MEQANLTTPAPHTLARRVDPVTSKMAAHAVNRFAAGQYEVVRRAMRVLGGPCGAEQIGAEARLDPYRVRKRLPELEREGLVRVVPGELRVTIGGRHERLWALVDVAH